MTIRRFSSSEHRVNATIADWKDYKYHSLPRRYFKLKVNWKKNNGWSMWRGRLATDIRQNKSTKRPLEEADGDNKKVRRQSDKKMCNK